MCIQAIRWENYGVSHEFSLHQAVPRIGGTAPSDWAAPIPMRSRFKRRVRTHELIGLRTSFVDDVKRSLRSTTEPREARGGNHLPDALFARLRAEAQSDFLRTRAGRAQQG